VSPGLARVVARTAVDAPFTPAVEQVQEALGATLSDETARRLAARIGTAAEARTQAAIARARQGQPVWTEAEVQRADDTTILVVEVDGVLVHQEAGWHEMKVGTLAPLGPGVHSDPTHGRATLAGGSASYGVGGEDAEACWWRVYVEALRRGLGTPAERTVVVRGDGAPWIWDRARAFLGLPAVEVVEIVDIYHAYGYLWAVGNALYDAGSLRAAAWVEPLKDHLYLHGAAPVLAAIAALTPTTEEALNAIADAQTYFTRNVARMDYPRFVARWKRGSNRPACAGVSPAVKPSPACAPCSARGAGRPSGRPTPISTGYRRRMPPRPPRVWPPRPRRVPPSAQRPRSRYPRDHRASPRLPLPRAPHRVPHPRPLNVRSSCPAPPRELCCGAPPALHPLDTGKVIFYDIFYAYAHTHLVLRRERGDAATCGTATWIGPCHSLS